MTSSTQPTLGAIRLAWWREALERLDSNPPPPEPRLQAVSGELLPRGISGKDLAALEDGWATLLEEEPEPGRIARRGERLFSLAARLLGAGDARLDAAGSLFAAEQLVRLNLPGSFDPVDEIRDLQGHRFDRRLRPLTALARLAARDASNGSAVEAEATPGRAIALLLHRLTGTVT